MATEKWIAGSGQGLTWSSALNSTELNSLANTDAVLIATQIDNSSALDIFADVCFILGSVTSTGSPVIGIYLYPLLEDGSTYGDGRGTGSGSAFIPPAAYWCGNAALPAGTQALTGIVSRIILPPAKFKFLLYNSAGVALASSGNSVFYRTYNRAIA